MHRGAPKSRRCYSPSNWTIGVPFRDRDLTQRPPRSPYLRSVAEVVTLARMADKARAFKIGKIGDYKYGENSGFDRRAMEFLGIDVDAFTEAAYENPNDGELGEWVRSQTHRAVTEISIFNAERTRFGLPGQGRERLNLLRSRLCPERVEIDRVFDLIDYDDQNSFGIVDLNRRPPRSPFDTGVCGLTGLARMIDKARGGPVRYPRPVLVWRRVGHRPGPYWSFSA